jgi:metallo-beta-lactamase class B
VLYVRKGMGRRKYMTGYNGEPLCLTNPDDGLYWFDAPVFSISADIHLLGCRDDSIHLITTEEGHVLVDTDFGNGSEYFALADIIHLGFDPKRIKYILLSHRHPDHVGGARRIREITGAEVLAHEWEADIIESGYVHIMPTDGSQWPIPGCPVDRRLVDGDVLEIGGKKIQVIHTPGHTAGCLTFVWETEVDGQAIKAGLSGICGEASLYGILEGQTEFAKGESPKDFKESLDRLAEIGIDLFLACHPTDNRAWDKYERLKKGEEPNPFIDSEGWKHFFTEMKSKVEMLECGVDIYDGKGWFGVKEFPYGIFGPQQDPD